MKRSAIFAALTAALFTVACGDSDSTGPGIAGSFELEVTGAIEETAEGPAWFGSDVNDEGQEVFALMLGDENSRHLVIAGKVGSTRPAVGTYDIGPNAWELMHFVSEDDELLALFFATDGQIQITESTSRTLRGTITFTAEGFAGEDAEIEGTITFNARLMTSSSFQTMSAARAPQ